ncbi:nucleolar transcription factor 1-like isoform X2 [Lineus longissimus]|uniref:nucleolar transcription factor 1-like isoform X2 n=1 Tax=Lineus longissimus TaxID=88925 RepID=UPI00315DA1AD
MCTQKYLEPSCIYYITSEVNNMTAGNKDYDVREISKKVLVNGDIPKVQVVEKDGHWFTLNNLQLEVCQRLQQDGRCKKVKADIIPISEIPDELLKLMVLPNKPKDNSSDAHGTSDTSRATGRGYQRLGQKEREKHAHNDDDDDDDDDDTTDDGDDDSDGSDSSSDCDDAESDYDWSEEAQDSSECDPTDDTDKKDIEKELLL